MTPEEKLMVIRDAFEQSFVHLANATYQFEGCTLSKKRDWTKEWMDWIVKLIEDDQETIENESTQYLTDDEVLEVARKKAYGIQLTKFPNALQVYIRGFMDGQWWLKNKNNENNKNNESGKNV